MSVHWSLQYGQARLAILPWATMKLAASSWTPSRWPAVSPESSTITVCASMAAFASIPPNSALKSGVRTPKPTRQRSRRRSKKRPGSQPITENGWQRKARFAGPACTAGKTCWTCWKKLACRNRWASRQTLLTRISIRWVITLRNTLWCNQATAMKNSTLPTRP